MDTKKKDDQEIGNDIDRNVKIVIDKARAFQAFNRDLYKNIDDFIKSMEEMRADLQKEHERQKREKREIILTAMEKMGLSRENLAEIANVGIEVIDDMLSGKKDLAISKLIKICLTLGISPRDIE